MRVASKKGIEEFGSRNAEVGKKECGKGKGRLQRPDRQPHHGPSEGQPHGEGDAYANGHKISREGISAIDDYVAKERAADSKKWKSPALYLSPATNADGDGRLNPRVIKTVFNEVCSLACVEDHTPYAACHAMDWHLIEKS
jgi:hypothetical protein